MRKTVMSQAMACEREASTDMSDVTGTTAVVAAATVAEFAITTDGTLTLAR
jgi:hypothetical protein